MLAWLEKQIGQCDDALMALVAADADLQKKVERLDAIPGVAFTTAALVLAQMPELGKLTPASADALVAAMRKLVILMNRLLKNPEFKLAS